NILFSIQTKRSITRTQKTSTTNIALSISNTAPNALTLGLQTQIRSIYSIIILSKHAVPGPQHPHNLLHTRKKKGGPPKATPPRYHPPNLLHLSFSSRSFAPFARGF